MEDDKTFINKRVTNQDVYAELMKQGKVQDEILTHAKYTNGRVAENLKKIAQIENKSVGCWIARNPIKFAVYMVVFTAFVLSDIRHPLFELLIKIFF